MTPPPENLPGPELRALIDRFRTITGPPIALHRGSPERQLLVCGSSACEACAYINRFPAGNRACARSRAEAFAVARETAAPIAFVCHLGFGCASAAVPGKTGWWVTVGPFVPESAADALEFAVRRGLEAVATPDAAQGPLPFGLRDIPARPPQAMAEAALWVAESIAPRLPETPLPPPPEAVPDTEIPSTPKQPRRGRRPAESERSLTLASPDFHRIPVSLAPPAIWLAGGYRARAADAWRRRVRERARLAGKTRPDPGILFEITAGVIECCERMGAATSSAWQSLAELRQKIEADPRSGLDESSCIDLLYKIRWPAASRGMFKTLCARWMEEIRNAAPDMESAAREIGISPASLSLRLRRMLNLNYSGCRSALRLELARERLESSGASIHNVARAAGLTDPANLHRLFRRHGLPAPGLYRWLLRREE